MADTLTIVDVEDRTEIESVARELAGAYVRRVAYYRNEYKMELADAQQQAELRYELALISQPLFCKLSDVPQHARCPAAGQLIRER